MCIENIFSDTKIYFIGEEFMTVSQNATRRNYKDSVFVDLFAHDITAKENFISLYNALHGTNLDVATTEIQPVMLEKVLYMKYYNDVAMLVDDKIVVMIEHQSTINENMPFRFLEYIARIYEKIVNPKEKFERKLVKIPVPEFYVFYNGKEDFPSESEMKLSDAFIKLDENKNFPLEISVKVININVDKENPVLNRCEALKEYSEFMEQVKFNIENEIPEALTVAIKQSIKQGFLSDYLSRKSTEVENMLLTEYDYDTDIAVQRQEAYEDGAQQKAIETAKNALNMNLPMEQITVLTGLSIDFIKTLK